MKYSTGADNKKFLECILKDNNWEDSDTKKDLEQSYLVLHISSSLYQAIHPSEVHLKALRGLKMIILTTEETC